MAKHPMKVLNKSWFFKRVQSRRSATIQADDPYPLNPKPSTLNPKA